MSLSPSIFGTNAIGNETALRIEALRVSAETFMKDELFPYSAEEIADGTRYVIERAEEFYKFMLNGTVPKDEGFVIIIPASEASPDAA